MTVSRVEYSGLDPLRTTAFLALTVALGVYYGIADELDPISTWWTIALLAFGVIPAVFALVYLALPLRLAEASSRSSPPAGSPPSSSSWSISARRRTSPSSRP